MNAPPFSYVGLSGFPLLWRWTQATHDVLTSHELASIKPLHLDSARVAGAHAKSLCATARDTDARVFRLSDVDERDFGEWLSQLPVPLDQRIVLSWGPTVALETTWMLLLSRWSAFWYPSSDQLIVFPSSGDWLLEVSDFGRVAWTPISAP